jgi:hypothetical protein
MMAGPAYYSGAMNIAKNEDWIVPFVYTMDNGDGTFTPIDLTGSTLTLEIRNHETDHEVFVAVTSDNSDGIVINNAPGGAFTIVIPRDRMVRMVPGDYVADLVREMTNGFQERLWEGVVNVVEGTTR